MDEHRPSTLWLTALAPAIWGTTYLVTTQWLPPGAPLTAGAIRALAAGLLLLLIVRRTPRALGWSRTWMLGALNIGVFFALLFIAAERLPGGVAATILATQPVLVAGLSAALLTERVGSRTFVAGAAGVFGVGLLVLQSDVRLDAIGLAAAVGGAIVMAIGVVANKRWSSSDPVLVTTAWQLVTGGVLLLPIAMLVEGLPTTMPSAANLLGYGYLSVIGAALAYVLWFRGIHALSPVSVSFLGLLSPVVAAGIGWLVLDEALGPVQILGVAIVLAAVLLARPRPSPAATAGDFAELSV